MVNQKPNWKLPMKAYRSIWMPWFISRLSLVLTIAGLVMLLYGHVCAETRFIRIPGWILLAMAMLLYALQLLRLSVCKSQAVATQKQLRWREIIKVISISGMAMSIIIAALFAGLLRSNVFFRVLIYGSTVAFAILFWAGVAWSRARDHK